MKMTREEGRIALRALGFSISRVDGGYRAREAACRNADHGFEESTVLDLVNTAKLVLDHGVSCCGGLSCCGGPIR